MQEVCLLGVLLFVTVAKNATTQKCKICTLQRIDKMNDIVKFIDGEIEIETKIENETVWITQKQMCEVSYLEPQNQL
jgi:hypothetical protein